MTQHSDSSHPHRPYPRVVAYPPKPQRHRPVHPHAAANSLAMKHLDIAEKVALNIARRTGHPVEDLRQIATLGILQASRRFSSERGSFRAYARTYANGEVYHFLREKGFLLKVSPRWRELHARGQKLLRHGSTLQDVPAALGISKEHWEEILLACSQRVVALDVLLKQEEWSDHDERQ
jgi:DNA-directed RNA polymerase specialized sigma subunit